MRACQRFKGHKTENSYHIQLNPTQLNQALALWTKVTQHAHFATEIATLDKRKPIPTSSALIRLNPFLDDHGLLRLRNRLRFSNLDPSEKQPYILPRTSLLARLVIDHHHRLTLHGGTQLMLASIRHRFWIIGGRVPIRSFIRRCVVCARQRATASQQQMGQLPAFRVTPCRPFLNTGVDYAGPITLKTSRGRGAKTYKGYLVIFVSSLPQPFI